MLSVWEKLENSQKRSEALIEIIYWHDKCDDDVGWFADLKTGQILGPFKRGYPSIHKPWYFCPCSNAESIRKRMEMIVDDSPSGNLSREDFVDLFNNVKLISDKTSPEELIARRKKMVIAIAKLKTHVQGISYSLEERAKTMSLVERKALKEADAKYVPKEVIKEVKAIPAKQSPMEKMLAAFGGDEAKLLAYLQAQQAKGKTNGTE